MKTQILRPHAQILAGKWRKISHHIIVGENVKATMPEPALDLLVSATRKNPAPASLLLEIRRNYLSMPLDIYLTRGEIQTSSGTEKVPALVHISNVKNMPFEPHAGFFHGKDVLFTPLGNSYEADARKLMFRSSILRSIPEEILLNPNTAIDWLADNRDRISEECYSRVPYSLGFFIHALRITGKITNSQTFDRLASGRDLYERSSILQNIPEDILNDPQKVIDWLFDNREDIRNQASQNESLALGTLIFALQAAKKISQDQGLARLAGAKDLYERSPILQSIPEDILNDPQKVIDWLFDNREDIRNQASQNESLALATLIYALQAAKRISHDQNLIRLAGARDLYERSSILQSIPESILNDPQKVIDWLFDNREDIRKQASENESLALATLIDALQAAKRVSYSQKFNWSAAARDYYDRTTALHKEEAILDSIENIIKFIDSKRESLLRIDKKGRVSYGYAINSLVTAHRIDSETIDVMQLRLEAAAADYARKHEDMIRNIIESALRKYHQSHKIKDPYKVAGTKYWRRYIDQTGFYSAKGDKLLSRTYIGRILKWAMRFYGTEKVLEIAKKTTKE